MVIVILFLNQMIITIKEDIEKMVSILVGTYNDARFSKDKAHDVSVHCPACVGRGLRRHRSTGVIPHIQIKTCTKCKGRGKIWVARGSELHLKGQQVVYSQDWKGDTFGTNINRQVPSHRK